jgi:hypothetical protein
MNSEAAPTGGEAPTKFCYRSLNPDINEIRLVTLVSPSRTRPGEINCSLWYTPLDDAPGYEALSYTWADADGDSSLNSMIVLDGFPFLITKNLAAALQQLRLPFGERSVWIDAICIDQTNGAERNHQVAMMKTIYERANEVTIWLGIERHRSDLAFDFLHGVLERADAEAWARKILTDPESKIFLSALCILFLRPYWDRIWIIQEVFSARKRTVYCGSNSISWARLIKARDYILHLCETTGASRITSTNFTKVMATEGPKSIIIPWNVDTQSLPDLLEMLLSFRTKISTDPRDKVYGITGLTSTRNNRGFTVDYSRTVSEVYRYVVKHVVTATHNLEIISVGKGSVHPEWLPSWAPDWSQPTKTRSSPIHSRGFNAALGKPVDATFDSTNRILRAQGIKIGMIQSVAIPLDDLHDRLSHESHRFYHLLLTICSWHELAKKAACDEAYQREAFYEIIVMRPYADHEFREDGVLLLESFAALIKQYMPKHPLDGLLRDALLRWQDKVPKEDRPVMMKQAGHIVDLAADNISGRRFFISSAGQMGLAPYRAEAGDVLCVLFGCPNPVILRPQDGYHTVIGDAYVYGLMYGEAIQELSDGKYTIQEFELH